MALSWLVLSVAWAGCDNDVAINYPPGGYAYPSPKDSVDTNFYYWPLRNVFSRRDSFRISSAYLIHNVFDELNISIKPAKKDIFRFEFFGFKHKPVIITFTNGEMMVKTGGKEYLLDYIFDENRLTDLEKIQYHFFEYRYPYYERNAPLQDRSRYVDSMIKTYPQLLDLRYYKTLLDKVKIPNGKHYGYDTKKIVLSSSEFGHLVSVINDSGYWKLPYSVPCFAEFFDGYGFSLEANTRTQYNFVEAGTCNEDRSKFAHICQEIVKCAALEKDVDLLWFTRPKAKEEGPSDVFVQDVTLADVKEPDSLLHPHKRKKKHK
jgi:hypothetical protein